MKLLTIILFSLMIDCQYCNMDEALVMAANYMNGVGVAQSEVAAVDCVVEALQGQPDVETAVKIYQFRIIEVLKPRNAKIVFDRVKDKSPSARRIADIIRNRGY